MKKINDHPTNIIMQRNYMLGLCPDLTPRKTKRCIAIQPEVPPKRPDPAHYSQEEAFMSGQPMTWDSPDIITNNTNAGLWPYIEITVRNISADAPALNTLVRLDWAAYGIGFNKSELFSMNVNLNRAGMTNDEVKLQYPTPNWISDAHNNISVRASVIHPHDRNSQNNSGEQAYSGSIIEAGKTNSFTFTLHNSLTTSTEFHLYVQESDWGSILSNTLVTLMPGQNSSETLNVNPPNGTTGTKGFNIVALVNGQLYGGIYHGFTIL